MSHVGIYAGDDRFVHAPQSGGNVRVASLEEDLFRRSFADYLWTWLEGAAAEYGLEVAA